MCKSGFTRSMNRENIASLTLPKRSRRNAASGCSSAVSPNVPTTTIEQTYKAKAMRKVTQNTAMAAKRKPYAKTNKRLRNLSNRSTRKTLVKRMQRTPVAKCPLPEMPAPLKVDDMRASNIPLRTTATSNMFHQNSVDSRLNSSRPPYAWRRSTNSKVNTNNIPCCIMSQHGKSGLSVSKPMTTAFAKITMAKAHWTTVCSSMRIKHLRPAPEGCSAPDSLRNATRGPSPRKSVYARSSSNLRSSGSHNSSEELPVADILPLGVAATSAPVTDRLRADELAIVIRRAPRKESKERLGASSSSSVPPPPPPDPELAEGAEPYASLLSVLRLRVRARSGRELPW
mmetsp:Transcript_12559/g.36063  ORF Transcript_12559/g.36063 Transcript_12559/m.36063 type:complete len:342 (-) Transcript_12559:149-1174(-)